MIAAILAKCGLRGMRAAGVLLGLALAGVATAAGLAGAVDFDIQPQKLATALLEFSKQAGVQVLTATEAVTELDAPGVRGRMEPAVAMGKLLEGTRLKFHAVGGNAIAIEGGGRAGVGEKDRGVRVAQGEGVAGNEESRTESASSQQLEEVEVAIPEILVKGSKILNMDIPRDRDSAQPYIIFDHEKIEQSGATSIEDFLKNRLPQNTVAATSSTAPGSGNFGNVSQINLRGLGTNQTLILIDGRRAPNITPFNGMQIQPDLNGIPLAAVERIEILPTTASGIYGGGATGGVVNVIMKRDYRGIESKVSYENTFDTDTGGRRVDLAAGFNLEGGKTNILIGGSYADQNPLALQDRDFAQDYRYRFLANNGNNYQIFTQSGSPPPGATPNIRSSTGANLTLRSGTALNSPITYVPAGYPGTADGGAALVANAGKYNLNWSNSGSSTGGGRVSMSSGLEVEALNATLRRQFTSNVQAFVDLGVSNNEGRGLKTNVGAFGYSIPAGISTNPFNQGIVVNVAVPFDEAFASKTRSSRAAAGIIIKLPHEWTTEADYVWNQSWNEFVYSVGDLPGLTGAIAGGTLNILRDTNAYPFDPLAYDSTLPTPQHTISPNVTTLRDSTLRLAGPLGLALPAGMLSVSGLLEHRQESVSDGSQFITASSYRFTPSRSQMVDSASVEIHVPVVSPRSKLAGMEELELQLVGRHDEYTTHGVTSQLVSSPSNPPQTVARAKNTVDSTDPTLGLRYRPVRDLALRASYGTGFLPPTVNQVTPGIDGNFTLTDPRRANAQITVPAGGASQGGNPNLQPEKSKSWSVGMVFTPRFIPQFRLSVDYTRINKEGAIAVFPGGDQAIINNESVLPGRITRGVKLATDPVDWAGPITFIDGTLFNLSKAEVEAYDVQLDYRKETGGAGTFDLFALTTWQTHYKTQAFDNLPVFENVGYTSNNPLKFKANAGVTWTRRFWTLGWNVRYFDSYLVYDATALPAAIATAVQRQGGAQVSDQVYHDVFVTYRFDTVRGGDGFKSRLLGGVELTLGIKNLFNAQPPFDSSRSLVYYSPYGDPRLASYWISARKNFGF